MRPRLQLPYDGVSWKESEKVANNYSRQSLHLSIHPPIDRFVARHSSGQFRELRFLARGAYNILFCMEYETAKHVVIRFAMPGAVMVPDEKVKTEVAVMRFIFEQIGIEVPVLFVVHESPTTTFDTALKYFESLAELHITHLVHERNDAIDSADDCRRKLVARYLFRKLARDGRLRGASILMNDELKIVGVVDWEFTFAAPVELSYVPPWRLLIEKPEYWDQGLDDWCAEYERRLQTFLKAIRRQEDEAIQQGWLEDSQRLSDAMRNSWKSGDFWVSYAARNNFTFDLVYWYKIDQRSFEVSSSTPIEDVRKQRMDRLAPEDRVEINKVVASKLKEMETRPLAWDTDDYTRELVEKGFGDNAPAVESEEAETGAGVDDGDVGSDKLAELSL
ncbi:hypothetical protein BDV06DRAFT_221336 [Aspergillus oleicola]